MKKLLFLMTFCALLCGEMFGQPIRVAVANTVKGQGNVQQVHLDQVRNRLNSAVMSAQGLSLAPRSTEVDALLSDYDFESNSTLTDAKKAILANVENVDFVCISKISEYSGEYYISALFLNKATGEPTNLVDEIAYGGKPSEIQEACLKLFDKLLKQLSVSGSGYGGSTSPSRSSTQGDRITVSVPGTSVSFEMVRVKAGSFTMGCTSEQSDCDNDETTHRVTLTEDFYMGIYEVTQELWQAVMGTNPSNFKGSDRPVESVSWDDAQAFCRELSSVTGKTFVLPTEAQWEYAARGGHLAPQQQPKYAGSFSVDAVAWYSGNSGSTTHPVGQKRANALGLYDMSGNVYEWCRDWYGSYGTSPQTEPTGPGSGSYRVLRGGSWLGDAGVRVSYRGSGTPSHRGNGLGIRVVCLP